jgi:hypothetical protein
MNTNISVTMYMYVYVSYIYTYIYYRWPLTSKDVDDVAVYIPMSKVSKTMHTDFHTSI